MRSCARLVVAAITSIAVPGVVSLGAPVARAEEPPPATRVGALVDIAYAFNLNRPADDLSFSPGLGTAGKRHDEIMLNAAYLSVSRAPSPVGFELGLIFGSSGDVLHAAEPAGAYVGPDVFRFVHRASVIVAPPSVPALTIEAGIYPSHIGLEAFLPADNWTYTRGWMAELSPYYQTGVKATWAFSPALSAQLHVMNGWQVIGDNNDAKAVGAQVAWTSSRASVALNGFAGPELADDDEHWRLFGDVVATVRPTDRIQLAATVDVGRQALPGDTSASWWAAGVHARLAPADRVAIALRGEVFVDDDGAISGAAQTLVEGTVCLEVTPLDGLILRLEGRVDHSDADVFATDELATDGTPVRDGDQVLFLLAAIARL